MTLNHRKLITDVVVNVTAFCESTCKSSCPDLCFLTCPKTCFNSNPPPNDQIKIHHSNRAHKLHEYLIICLSILGFACFIFFLYTMYKNYQIRNNYRRRSPGQEQEEETHNHDEFFDEHHVPILDHPIWYIRTVGLQSSVINLITVCKYKKGEGLVEGTECSVCLSEFEEDETLRLLPKCNHAFHLPCIDTWLRSHTNCPLCRAPIVTNPNGSLTPRLEQTIELEDSAVTEENQEVISEGSEDGNYELIRELEEETGLQIEIGTKGVESSKRGIETSDYTEQGEVQPMRRSVSMDSLSASMLSTDIAKAQSGIFEGNPVSGMEKTKESNTNSGIVPKGADINQSLLRFVGGSSIGRSLQKGPVLMQRSLSCSGKVLFSRYNRNRNTILPS